MSLMSYMNYPLKNSKTQKTTPSFNSLEHSPSAQRWPIVYELSHARRVFAGRCHGLGFAGGDHLDRFQLFPGSARRPPDRTGSAGL